jgi:hypothetical protein
MIVPKNIKEKFTFVPTQLISGDEYFSSLTKLQLRDLKNPIDRWLMSGHRTIGIQTGQTNNGKSHYITTELGPTWLTQYGNLHIMVAPHKSTLTPSEINIPYLESVYKKKGFCNTVFASEDSNFSWKSLKRDLKQAKHLLVITDSRLSRDFKKPEVVEIIQSICENNKVLVTRDEMSYGTVLEWMNYKEATGHSNHKHKGVYINNLVEMWEWGASLIGFTATPHGELTGELQTSKGNVYELLSDFPSKEDYTFHQGWIGEKIILPPLERDDWDDELPVKYLKHACSEPQRRKESIDILLNPHGITDNEKFVSMIMLETEPRKDPNPNRLHASTLKRLVREYSIIPKGQQLMIVLESGWEILNHEGNLIKDGKGEDWLDIIKDDNDPTTILASLYKLQYGVNIQSICHLLSFRCPTASNSDGPVLIQGIQTLGRAVRNNLIGNGKKGLYIINELNQRGLYSTLVSYLKLKNTFDFFGIDDKQPFWTECLEVFLENYGSDFQTEVVPQLFKENKGLMTKVA